jgi:hypothetical protein
MEKRKAGDAPASSKPHAVKKLKMWYVHGIIGSGITVL